MPILRVIDLDRRKPESCYLQDARRDVTSQFGEDGIIEKIFEIVPPANRWCVEYGAWDGVYLSNTYHLVHDLGWNGVLIEGDPAKFAELETNCAGLANAHPVQAVVGFDNGVDALDDVLAGTDCPHAPDLASIDVDGADYFLWQSMKAYRPRVVVIEFNPTVPNDVVFVQDRDLAVHQGASLAAMVELGKRKRYELVAVTNCNAFFVDEPLFPAFGIEDNSIDAMRANVTGRIFHGYDGTIYTKMRPLQWVGRGDTRPPIDVFQLLPPEERNWHDKLESQQTDSADGEDDD
ncbi:FkbM family methyltransferase [Nocardioides antri]|uniref:FkbM family methyltransferase n=1 Tax=Nocardioides antri TaxID=2607659 RepID=A0A5B1LYD8_9ACTN|nr:FkbM family methyltransferase [Nocardioides antri]KAA1425591.1 FkbM family methyltransferase [Nocardioides antri]